jgi:hypothetical protein
MGKRRMNPPEEKDGYKILMYLRGEKTAEFPCKDRIDAEELLLELTAQEESRQTGAAKPLQKVDLVDYDVAELWRGGRMIALGLRNFAR